MKQHEKARNFYIVEKQKVLDFLSTRSPLFKGQRSNLVRRMGVHSNFSSLSNASVGVSILFNNVCEIQLFKTNSDPNGRFVISDIKTDSKTLTLVNIYIRNNDEPSFVDQF